MEYVPIIILSLLLFQFEVFEHIKLSCFILSLQKLHYEYWYLLVEYTVAKVDENIKIRPQITADYT